MSKRAHFLSEKSSNELRLPVLKICLIVYIFRHYLYLFYLFT